MDVKERSQDPATVATIRKMRLLRIDGNDRKHAWLTRLSGIGQRDHRSDVYIMYDR